MPRQIGFTLRPGLATVDIKGSNVVKAYCCWYTVSPHTRIMRESGRERNYPFHNVFNPMIAARSVSRFCLRGRTSLRPPLPHALVRVGAHRDAHARALNAAAVASSARRRGSIVPLGQVAAGVTSLSGSDLLGQCDRREGLGVRGVVHEVLREGDPGCAARDPPRPWALRPRACHGARASLPILSPGPLPVSEHGQQDLRTACEWAHPHRCAGARTGRWAGGWACRLAVELVDSRVRESRVRSRLCCVEASGSYISQPPFPAHFLREACLKAVGAPPDLVQLAVGRVLRGGASLAAWGGFRRFPVPLA